ncbi:MAG: DUF2029 domain-containing protein [Nitriliruptorales bacterium]|nr:DUF2029 domain-containing protein [Nitriliruptorales bacterium]
MTVLRRAWLPTLLCCLTLLIGWWSKARCLGDGTWTGAEQYLQWCYTDVFPLWTVERLDEGAVPYFDHPVEYPVLTGLQMWLGQQVAQAFPPDLGARAFFHVTALMNAVLSLAVLGLLALAGLPARRRLWWALAPPLAVYAFLNWDPLAVALMVGAILAHLRDRDLEAGALAGLGVAAKLIPGVVIPLILAARLAQGRSQDALRHLFAAAGVWLVVNLPVAVLVPESWSRFFVLNRERPANFDSLWYLAEQVRGAAFPVAGINLASALLLLGGWLVIAAVGMRRRDPSEWWALALPALCWFLVTNKVYSPQYTLWILPLAALSLRRPAPYLGFVLADVTVYLVEFPFLGGLQGAAPAPTYGLLAVTLLMRAGMLLWIAVESTLDHDETLTAAAGPKARLRQVGRAQPA